MRVMMSDLFGGWTQGAGLIALAVLVWAIVVPNGIFWSAALAVSLVGAAIATTLLVRSRRVPTLAEVITSAKAEPALALVPIPAATRARSGFAR